MEGIRIFLFMGTVIASIVMVITRRMIPVSFHNIGVVERSFFSGSSPKTRHRNRWNIFVDIGIQFVQLQREQVSLSQVHTLRKKVDSRSLPINRKKVSVEKVNFKASNGQEIHGEWLIPTNENNKNQTILYFHGGGFWFCSLETHRHLVSKIAIASKTRVFIFKYRRTPEHMFPSQIEDSTEAYKYLLSKEGGSFLPNNIIFAGDSAGGNLSVTVPLHLREINLPLPSAIVAISPWTDLTNSSDTWKTNYPTDFLPPASMMSEISRLYVPATMELTHPKISPIFADLTAFPPIYIQCSDSEQLYDDSLNLAKTGRNCGVDVTLDIFQDLPHVFQAFGGNQAENAIQKIGQWVMKKNGDLEQSLHLNLPMPTFQEYHKNKKRNTISCDAGIRVN